MLTESYNTDYLDELRDRIGELEPGYTLFPKATVFKFYAPRASIVYVELSSGYDTKGTRLEMDLDDDGFWSLVVPKNLKNYYYGYRIIPPKDYPNDFQFTDELIADPYSKHVTSRNHYKQFAKTLIYEPEPFDWTDKEFTVSSDLRDLIIYEAHIKDMSAHPNLGAVHPGSYKGFLEQMHRGGINHLKRLGVNAVEFLPLQKFAHYEPPFMEATEQGVINNWNYYGRNHWGYMTSHYFCPETFYASDAPKQYNAVIGSTTTAHRELKEVVNELHRNNIAVILDVVYNHVSNYDLNPLKYADKEHYFRLEGNKGYYASRSGCGNDLRTESKMARKLIIDSLIHWMKEYHIDGFRFDLAALIDWKTIDEIKKELEAINPNVVLIAEPWFIGGYEPTEFSLRRWGAWNDKIRNGIKGVDPIREKGFIFGTIHGNSQRDAVENYLRGSLIYYSNGIFASNRYTVNYLEAHDGYTLGDFIRIALDEELAYVKVPHPERLPALTQTELELNKIAALILFVSQGCVMIHEGQEWARAKVIAQNGVSDPHSGFLDHNSYEKDNRTNYLNFEEIVTNRELFNYYKGLISIRKACPALRKSDPNSIQFYPWSDARILNFTIDGSSASDPFNYFCCINAADYDYQTTLPPGTWEVLVNKDEASEIPLSESTVSFIIARGSGALFRQRRT